jgi:hypothetical protein
MKQKGFIEWALVFLISFLAGVGTVEYQKARQKPEPFQSPALQDNQAPFINGIKIDGKDAQV